MSRNVRTSKLQNKRVTKIHVITKGTHFLRKSFYLCHYVWNDNFHIIIIFAMEGHHCLMARTLDSDQEFWFQSRARILVLCSQEETLINCIVSLHSGLMRWPVIELGGDWEGTSILSRGVTRLQLFYLISMYSTVF